MERAENMGFVMQGERCFQNTELKGRESREAEKQRGREGEEGKKKKRVGKDESLYSLIHAI